MTTSHRPVAKREAVRKLCVPVDPIELTSLLSSPRNGKAFHRHGYRPPWYLDLSEHLDRHQSDLFDGHCQPKVREPAHQSLERDLHLESGEVLPEAHVP